SSGNISFNNPSAPGIHNFRIGSSEPTEHQPDPLRIAFLECQIAGLTSQYSSVIRENIDLRSENIDLRSQLSFSIQKNKDLQTQVAELQYQVDVQQIAISIPDKEFIKEFSSNNDQISADD
ncbi:3896_t:CDS:1, partial [Racocetra fulgida]